MTDVALFNLIDRMLWGVAIAVLIICGLFFWYRAYFMEILVMSINQFIRFFQKWAIFPLFHPIWYSS